MFHLSSLNKIDTIHNKKLDLLSLIYKF